ncbi:uncharacterized protein LOC142564463 [Dermacentor variabilis]|uniref:uncharacterized protein LOC142564463 n=1 Tax=Dermacentor variabilis TaxID=34621 RepID=UPI003F5B52A2
MDRKAAQPEIPDEKSGQKTDDLQHLLTNYLRYLYRAEPYKLSPNDPYGGPGGREDSPKQPSDLGLWAVSRQAIDTAIGSISAHTAHGLDNIPAGVIKHLGPQTRDQLADIFNDILAGDPVPRDWLRGKVTLVPKRGGDPGLIRDYRPLTITSVFYRVFAQVIKTWMSG